MIDGGTNEDDTQEDSRGRRLEGGEALFGGLGHEGAAVAGDAGGGAVLEVEAGEGRAEDGFAAVVAGAGDSRRRTAVLFFAFRRFFECLSSSLVFGGLVGLGLLLSLALAFLLVGVLGSLGGARGGVEGVGHSGLGPVDAVLADVGASCSERVPGLAVRREEVRHAVAVVRRRGIRAFSQQRSHEHRALRRGREVQCAPPDDVRRVHVEVLGCRLQQRQRRRLVAALARLQQQLGRTRRLRVGQRELRRQHGLVVHSFLRLSRRRRRRRRDGGSAPGDFGRSAVEEERGEAVRGLDGVRQRHARETERHALDSRVLQIEARKVARQHGPRARDVDGGAVGEGLAPLGDLGAHFLQESALAVSSELRADGFRFFAGPVDRRLRAALALARRVPRERGVQRDAAAVVQNAPREPTASQSQHGARVFLESFRVGPLRETLRRGGLRQSVPAAAPVKHTAAQRRDAQRHREVPSQQIDFRRSRLGVFNELARRFFLLFRRPRLGVELARRVVLLFLV
mmetsp:Transcript_5085/g.15994  ORF Transcript_5085/g.15994 Transcript_5085/m.15994 type:complete len:513 (+) Transcript_5085:155-1693(+)